MKKKILLILVAILMVVTGCEKKGEKVEVESQSEDDFNVEVLFEVDSIRVYRFYDCGEHYYFTNKDNKIFTRRNVRRY